MNVIVDKEYCMSSFLAYRYVTDLNIAWKDGVLPYFKQRDYNRLDVIYSVEDIEKSLYRQFKNIDLSKTGIMLSGGMDSAILATYVPKGTKAYTMRTTAEGSVNEVEQAKFYADKLGLDLKVVDITWDDYLESIPIIAKHKKSPFHSIEPQIYKTLLTAKQDGCEYILSGENADSMFGGLDGLLSKNWTFEDFIGRFCYLNPKNILINYKETKQVLAQFENAGYVDVHKVISHFFAEESMNSYINPADIVGIKFIAPYAYMKMGCDLDLERIRRGESKYLIRELFAKRYNGLEPNKKLPMPRAVGVWLKDWEGPKRPEFKKFDINTLKPDQKWLVYILEQFLNLLDEGKI